MSRRLQDWAGVKKTKGTGIGGRGGGLYPRVRFGLLPGDQRHKVLRSLLAENIRKVAGMRDKIDPLLETHPFT